MSLFFSQSEREQLHAESERKIAHTKMVEDQRRINTAFVQILQLLNFDQNMPLNTRETNDLRTSLKRQLNQFKQDLIADTYNKALPNNYNPATQAENLLHSVRNLRNPATFEATFTSLQQQDTNACDSIKSKREQQSFSILKKVLVVCLILFIVGLSLAASGFTAGMPILGIALFIGVLSPFFTASYNLCDPTKERQQNVNNMRGSLQRYSWHTAPTQHHEHQQDEDEELEEPLLTDQTLATK